MGVVKRQGIKQSIVNYIGVAIGAISTIFIYSQDTETYGFARFIIDTAILISPFILLGANSVSIKFFPEFKNDKNKHNGFLGFLTLIVICGALILGVFLFFFYDSLLSIYADKPQYYSDQFYKIGILGVLLALSSLFNSYIANFQRIVVPNIFLNFIKVSLPIFILLFIWEKISLNFLANGILITYVLAVVGSIIYCWKLGQLNFKINLDFIHRERFGRIVNYSMFSLLSGLGVLLVFRIDSVMVTTILDFKSNGAYNIAAFIGNAVAIPGLALMAITSPLISKAFNENDMEHIHFLYKQTSINVLIFGLLFFVLVVASIEDLFQLMPTKDIDVESGFYIVFILGLSRIIEMGTSVNSQIINYSAYYRFNIVAIVILAILNIVLNAILIPKFQIMGAAIATFISIALFNLLKLIFIYIKFKIQPFSKETLIALGFATLAFTTYWFAPDFSHPLINICVKSILITAIYVPLILYFQVSKDVNELCTSGLLKVRNFFNTRNRNS